MVWVIPFLVIAVGAFATVDDFSFESEAENQRYTNLIGQFRCPKCLNTNLAGSDAPIAQDLRRAVYRLMQEGKTDQEIRDFMRDRYGDYILYDPRLTPATLILWFSPLLLVLGAAWLLLRLKDRRQSTELTPEESARLRELAS